jgi:uncharacterized protein (DUF433 family)
MPATKNLRPTEAPHIYLDDEGRAWIDDTAYRVSMVVLDYCGPDGFTPEQIVEEHYHALTLGQVHAALSYYYDHKAAIDAEIAEETRYYEESRAKAEQDPKYQEWKAKLLRKRQELGLPSEDAADSPHGTPS